MATAGKVYCPHCYYWIQVSGSFNNKNPEVVALRAQVAKLKSELDAKPGKKTKAAPTSGSDVPLDIVQGAIRLSHPDKHGNSALSNKITTWLLQLRNKLMGDL